MLAASPHNQIENLKDVMIIIPIAPALTVLLERNPATKAPKAATKPPFIIRVGCPQNSVTSERQTGLEYGLR
jgi:hypothetical protein